MERSLTFIIDNGVAQSADASLLGILDQPPSPSEHRHFQEHEEAGFHDEASNGDDDLTTISEEIAQSNINRVIPINLPAWAIGPDFQDLMARIRQEAHGGAGEAAGEVFVPASDAALAALEKQAFHATAERYDDDKCGGITTGCAICLVDFDDGEVVTVMPCSREHQFHPECITKWLGKSNTCPLCRHALPTDIMDDWMTM